MSSDINGSFRRLLGRLRDRNDAGQVRGVMLVAFQQSENSFYAQRTGYISDVRRYRNAHRLMAEARRDLNFRKSLGGERREYSVPKEVKEHTAWVLEELDRRYGRGGVDGFCGVVYAADGAAHAFSMSNASRSVTLLALDQLIEVASEEGIWWSSGNLDECEPRWSSERPRALDKFVRMLPAQICADCGELMYAVAASPDFEHPTDLVFTCRPCGKYLTVAAPVVESSS